MGQRERTGGADRAGGERAAALGLGTAEDVAALAWRLRGLGPPSWAGPASQAFEESLRRQVGRLDDATDDLRRAVAAARRLGEG